MFRSIGFSLLGLLMLGTIAYAAAPLRTCTADGGPPSIRIAGRPAGDIGHAEWGRAEKVELAGCVASAQVVEITLRIPDAKAKYADLHTKGDRLNGPMLSRVADLPPGTAFTILVKAIDGHGKALEVAPAHFMWRG